MYRRYTLLLTALLLTGLAAALAATAWLDPLDGDLTRLGGYTENRFGWTSPQFQFDPPLAVRGQLGHAYDVVVIGDSFSSITTRFRDQRAGGFWTDHLAALTGLSVGVFDYTATPLDTLVNSIAATPPRLFVLELVERDLRKVPDVKGDCTPVAQPVPLPALPRAAAPPAPRLLQRPRTAGPDPWRLPITIGQAGTALEQLVPGRDVNFSAVRPFDGPVLFSSRDTSALLFFAGDLLRPTWPEADWQATICHIRAVQALVTRRLGSAFLLLPAPDKASVYAPFLPPAARPINAIARLAATADLPILRTDSALHALIARGERDVYLPNDTHWGSAGARAAAEAVLAATP